MSAVSIQQDLAILYHIYILVKFIQIYETIVVYYCTDIDMLVC